MTKKMVEDSVSISEELDGLSVEQVKFYMDTLIDEYGDGHISLRYGWDDTDLKYVYKRLETEAEYLSRIKGEEGKQKRMEKKLEKERKQYERLHAKFGEKK